MAIVRAVRTSICWLVARAYSRTGGRRLRPSSARARSTCCPEHEAGSHLRVHPGDQGRRPAPLQGHVHLPGRTTRSPPPPCSTSARATASTQITTLLTHVCYGELRHAVSHMTMVECIEQRKTTLSGVVAAALQATIHSDGDDSKEWGIRIEASQVAQVFIVDPTLRQQLEAEVRNEIKLKADQSKHARPPGAVRQHYPWLLASLLDDALQVTALSLPSPRHPPSRRRDGAGRASARQRPRR